MRIQILGLITITALLIVTGSSAHAIVAANCTPKTDSAAGCTGLVVGSTCSCLNYSCDAASLGMTTLDGNKQNIIACLRDDSGNRIWKSMSGAVTAECSPGEVLQGIDKGKPVCVSKSPFPLPTFASCPSTYTVGNIVLTATGLEVSCNALYSPSGGNGGP